MDKEESLKRAKDPKYIPGIYNYCDRWCERCPFTSRCLNCSLDGEQKYSAGELDITNEKFWEKITESFELALNLIEGLTKEHGLDMDAIEVEPDDDEKAVFHILSRMTQTYIDSVDEWFRNHPALIENNLHRSHLKLVQPQQNEAPVPLKDAIEVITWYQYPIHVKLSRALRSKENEKKLEFDDLPKDSDGSAKIALIEMDRSISAWGELLKYFTDPKKGIVEICRYLKRIRDIAEKEFPDARAFVRPGFDEIEQNG